MVATNIPLSLSLSLLLIVARTGRKDLSCYSLGEKVCFFTLMYSWSIPSNDDRATGPQDRILHVMLYLIISKRGFKVKVCLFPIDRFASGMCGALGY